MNETERKVRELEDRLLTTNRTQSRAIGGIEELAKLCAEMKRTIDRQADLIRELEHTVQRHKARMDDMERILS